MSSSFVRALTQSIAPEFQIEQSGVTVATSTIINNSAQVVGGIFVGLGDTTNVWLGDTDGLRVYVASMAVNTKNLLCCPDGIFFNGKVNLLLDSAPGLRVDYTLLYRNL